MQAAQGPEMARPLNRAKHVALDLIDRCKSVGDNEQPNVAEIAASLPDGTRHVVTSEGLLPLLVQPAKGLLEIGADPPEARFDVGLRYSGGGTVEARNDKKQVE